MKRFLLSLAGATALFTTGCCCDGCNWCQSCCNPCGSCCAAPAPCGPSYAAPAGAYHPTYAAPATAAAVPLESLPTY